jgi:hypothetical protein
MGGKLNKIPKADQKNKANEALEDTETPHFRKQGKFN